MAELMKRIADLRAFRWALINGKGDPDMLPAAIDWLDGAIAEHEADWYELIRQSRQVVA